MLRSYGLLLNLSLEFFCINGSTVHWKGELILSSNFCFPIAKP